MRSSKPISLQNLIEVSDQQLDQQARRTLRLLAVFPAKPNSFSEEAALAVCQVSVEVLDVLSDVGLVEGRGSGRYSLHQTIADYARTHLADMPPTEGTPVRPGRWQQPVWQFSSPLARGWLTRSGCGWMTLLQQVKTIALHLQAIREVTQEPQPNTSGGASDRTEGMLSGSANLSNS